MRKIKGLFIVFAFLGLIQVVFANGIFGLFELMTATTPPSAAQETAPLLPRAADKERAGFPHVNYDDARPSLRTDGNSAISPAVAGVTADFDSDGLQDLVSVDAGGKITFFKGDADTIYPNSSEAKIRRAESGEATAFLKAVQDRTLPISPDFLATGDFNADGKSDILAAAKGTNILYLAAGDGNGIFLAPSVIKVDGQITALETGEIGRQDQQTDIAVAYSGKGGSFVAIYEHPEGAFARKPEKFTLPSAATSLAIGNLDKDPYGDVAAACGSSLTLIHGRGQAYPLDMKADLDIQRPSAFVQSRQMPFTIGDISVGRFGKERGESIAVLLSDGRIDLLEPQRNEVVVTTNKFTRDEIQQTDATSMKPVGADTGNYGVMKNELPKTETEADERGQLMADAFAIKEDREKVFSDKFAALQKESAKLTPAERAKKLSDDVQKTLDTKARRKEAYEATLAPKPVPFSKFRVQTIAADPAIAAAVSNGRPNNLVKGRFSDSGLDDLAIIDAVTGNIHIIGKWDGDQQTGRANTVSINAAVGSSAIVPMRLNTDGLSDLVLLGYGQPTVMMSQPTTVFEVNSADDDGGDCLTPGSLCTLRRAVFLANRTGSGTVAITFNIPGDEVHTINLESQLENIRRPMMIDGTTQPGYSGFPRIEIDGYLMAGGAHEGLKIQASNSVVRGLAINRFTSVFNDDNVQIGGSAITILSTNFSPNVNSVIIESNFLGTDVTGEAKKPNDANGVHIYDADANTIGGTLPLARNVLSGNGNFAENKQGVGLAITGGDNNLVYGNYIGTNAFGTLKVGNSYGVFFTGINNQFGGDFAGQGNVVSGNGGPPNQNGQCQGGGIYMFGLISLDDGSVQTDVNNIRGNKIGTSANGISPLGNCTVGISSPSDVNTTVGSITQPGRNTIADNGWDALYCGYASQSTYNLSGACYIIGNNIGTDITGNVAMRNDQRNNSCVGFCLITDTVWVTPSELSFAVIGSPAGTTPGGECTGMCNLISGNLDPNGGFGGGGLYRSGLGFVLALNNHLGVNRSGTAALPNRQGFNSYYGSFVFGAELDDGNGGTVDGGNIASGNDQSGTSTTHIESGGTFEIRGNIVGLSSDGNTPIGNGVGGTTSCGICARSFGGTSAAIGGTGNLQRNYVAAETSDTYYNGTRGTGLSILTSVGSSATVFNNWIGLNKSGNLAPNSGNGIEVSGDGRTRIGGYNPGEMNIIIGNGRAGVVVSQYSHPSTGISPTKNVTIARNGIAINGGLGIDLVNSSLTDPYPSGVTPNDCFDQDDGANGFQNYPVLFPPVINADQTVSVPTTLRSVPVRQFIIDYYQSPSADPTNYGEGSNYLGSATVQTDGNGFAGFTFTSPDPIIPTQLTFTATATDEFGNTSEFSCAAGVCETGSFQQAIERPEEITCIAPIIVTVDTDESDPNTADGVCDVDTNTTGLQCSLRAAMQEANARNGFDVINFDIPGGGVRTIMPMTALPTITERVMINGTTQPGYTTSPVIEIKDGDNAGIGIAIQSNNVDINGLAIHRFVNADISIVGSDNRVESCYLGIFPDGMTADNSRPAISAIVISGSGSQRNRIGGAMPANGNVIGNSDTGIFLQGSKTTTVINNKIGTNKLGTGALPNGIGITIGASNGNTIGGILDEDTNLISGNTNAGIDITAGSNTNRIEGNMIGTDITGNAPLKNGLAGLLILSSATDNTIGGSADRRNIISGNAPDGGIVIGNGAGENTISGNYIGVNKAGTAALPNKWGVTLLDAGNGVGSSTGPPNIVSGNEIGIVLSGEATQLSNVNIVNNRIGTDPSGNDAIPNRQGVVLLENVTNSAISQNLISGNTEQGILTGGFTVGPSNISISDNKIGTKENGTDPLPNRDGIMLFSGTNNSTVSGNTISGNTNSGLQLGGGGVASQPALDLAHILGRGELTKTLPIENNTVTGNRIGTTSSGAFGLANGKTGVFLAVDAFNNQIGGKRSAFEGNVISGNDQTPGIGIAIGNLSAPFDVEDHPTGNKIQGNRIGIKASGYTALPNNVGIKVKLGNNNLIGGDPKNCTPDIGCDINDYANIVGGNAQQGIWLDGTFAANNRIVSNYVGVAPDGTSIGNGGDGIFVSGAVGTLISETVSGANGGNGINVSGFSEKMRSVDGRDQNVPEGTPDIITTIEACEIGLIKTLEGPLKKANQAAGVRLEADRVYMRKKILGEPNVVSGNAGPGVLVIGQSATNNRIEGSIIGTDENGAADLGNGGEGIKIVDSSNNIIGSPVGDPNQETTVAGNVANGVLIEGQGAQLNGVFSSVVGMIRVNQAFQRVANGQNGIAIVNAANNVIGGTNSLLGNKVSGNARSGILVSGGQAVGNAIRRNLVGIDSIGSAFGNVIHGIHLLGGANNNIVGGDDPNDGNTIGGNGGSGIFIEDGEPEPRTEGTQSTQNNQFAGNRIFGNAGLGIDIFPAGGNPNDAGDADGGPNRGQNYPEIDDFSIDGNGDLIVSYLVDSEPSNSNYGANGIKVEFFISDATGQGRLPITSSQFWTISDYNNGGFKQINLGNAAQLGFQLGDSLTAAATDADGNTSEFIATTFAPSPTPTASSTATPEAVISGKITYGNAVDAPAVRFVSNALVHASGTTVSMTTGTNSNGEYSLSGFDSGAYTITPSKVGGQNNAITSFDAALISQHMVGPPFPQLTASQLSVADVSGNGNVSSFDAAQIAHYVVSSPPSGATGNWKFDPQSYFHATVNSSIVGEDYTALLMGEVSGNWIDGGARAANETDNNVTVIAPQLTASADKDVVVPIRVQGAANKEIIAYEFDLRYDASVIRPQADPIDLAGTVSRNLTAVFNAETPGLLRVAVYGPTPIDGNGVLLNLKFKVVGTTGAASQLIWERLIFNENVSPVLADGLIELTAIH